MQLHPRYDGRPLIRLEAVVDDPSTAVLRQRRRLGEALSELDEAQWAAASRCEGWSVRDVVVHLTSTNQFWAMSVAAGLEGTPTRFLDGFDPVATPAQLVGGLRSVTSPDVLARYRASVESVAGVLTGLDADGWGMLAEAPPGLVDVAAVAAHALWDAWVHERDILVPLGLSPVEEPDEVATALRYAAALGPAFDVSIGSGRRGTLAVDAVDPAVRFVVEVGDEVVVRDGEAGVGTPCLRGSAVALVEGLSFRAELPHDLADGDRWLLQGLDQVFDRT